MIPVRLREFCVWILGMLLLGSGATVMPQDFVRVYDKERLVFEAPVGTAYTKELPAATDYRMEFFSLAAQTPEITLSPGDAYTKIKINLVSLFSSPTIVLGDKTEDAGTREVLLAGKVELGKEILASYVAIKTFKNQEPDAETAPSFYGQFRLPVTTAPGSYSLACYVKGKVEKLELLQEQPVTRAGITFVAKSTKLGTMNFKGTNLSFILQYLSNKADVAFVVDDALMADGGKKFKDPVNLISSRPMTLDETFDMLNSLLSLKNIVLLKEGKIWKVTTAENAGRHANEVITGRVISDLVKATPTDDRIVTEVIPLQYARASSMKSIVEPLVSERGKVLHDEASNRLVVTDTTNNLGRITKILTALDVPVSQEVPKVYPIRYMSTDRLEQILLALFTSTQGGTGTAAGNVVRIVPSAQTRDLIVLASPPTHERIKQIIDKLDTQGTSEEATFTYAVKYNNADKLAEICSKLYGNPAKGSSNNTPAVFYPDSVSNILVVRTNQTLYNAEITPLLQTLDTARGSRIENFVYRLSHTNAERLEKELCKIYAGGEDKSATDKKAVPIRIVADKITNSLVVASTASEYENILKTIKELDIETKQVLIEVIIAEVTINDSFKSGVDWFYKNTDHFGRQDMDGTFATDMGLGKPNALSGFRYVVEKENLSMVLNLLSTATELNILSAPRVYTANNSNAKIVVGAETPIITSRQDRKNDTSDTVTRNFEYREVGLITMVTPFINNKDEVTLDVLQEISNIDRYADPPDNTAPIISKRQVNTQIRVKNEETAIIGGLFQDKENVSISKTPLLGDLPLIGLAFTSQTRTREKTELLVFITPRVVHSPGHAPEMMGLSKKVGHFAGEDVPISAEKVKWLQKPRKWERTRRD